MNMIEVIKNNARKEVECSNCNSVIAYDPIDKKTSKINGNIETLVYCPVCGKNNTLNTIYGVDADDIYDPSYVSGGLETEIIVACHCPICKKIYRFTLKNWGGEKYCECGKSFYIHDFRKERR